MFLTEEPITALFISVGKEICVYPVVISVDLRKMKEGISFEISFEVLLLAEVDYFIGEIARV